MFISADKIIDLIQVCRDVKERMGPEDHRIHVDDIAATLQKLIDDEVAEMDKMAEHFQAEENERLNQQAIRLEEEEWGRLQMEEAALEKELEIDFNWPGGI
jgi:hypothetical protein